jgi:hypothetical protein
LANALLGKSFCGMQATIQMVAGKKNGSHCEPFFIQDVA